MVTTGIDHQQDKTVVQAFSTLKMSDDAVVID
jgi:hypothetical protein